jgi:aromatic ring-opening dioxygenase catalytic subunit (LigB family)
MPIQMGLCSSHAPGLFAFTAKGWELVHQRLHVARGAVLSREIAEETPEVLESYSARNKRNWETMHQVLTDFKPDALIAVIGDQREWFDASNIPNICVYDGPDMWTVHTTGSLDEEPPAIPTDDPRFHYQVHVDQELSHSIADGLLKEGFDIAVSSKMNPLSQPKRGVPHGLGNTAFNIFPSLDLPVVLIFVNVDDGPPAILNGERCYELGQAIARICESSGKRIAIYGSGGMSHDPGGPRASWIDQPLDLWFMDQLTGGTMNNLKSMFSFPSENFKGGTGELRCWVTVAGAIDYVSPGHKAHMVDYFAAHKTTTGSGWAYWPAVEAPSKTKEMEPASSR